MTSEIATVYHLCTEEAHKGCVDSDQAYVTLSTPLQGADEILWELNPPQDAVNIAEGEKSTIVSWSEAMRWPYQVAKK